MILNHKELYKLIPDYHFKMNTFDEKKKQPLNLIAKSKNMASLDLRHSITTLA